MSWDYAELSHMAKEAGGPDMLLSTLKNGARSQGRIEGAGIGALVAGAVITGAVMIYNKYNQKKAMTVVAEEELTKGILEYNEKAEGSEQTESDKEGTIKSDAEIDDVKEMNQ